MEACYGLMLLWGDPYDRRGPASQEAIDFFNEVCLIGFLNEKYCSNKSGKPVLRSSEFEGR